MVVVEFNLKKRWASNKEIFRLINKEKGVDFAYPHTEIVYEGKK